MTLDNFKNEMEVQHDERLPFLKPGACHTLKKLKNLHLMTPHMSNHHPLHAVQQILSLETMLLSF